jgi:hypothetical protein
MELVPTRRKPEHQLDYWWVDFCRKNNLDVDAVLSCKWFAGTVSVYKDGVRLGGPDASSMEKVTLNKKLEDFF